MMSPCNVYSVLPFEWALILALLLEHVSFRAHLRSQIPIPPHFQAEKQAKRQKRKDSTLETSGER